MYIFSLKKCTMQSTCGMLKICSTKISSKSNSFGFEINKEFNPVVPLTYGELIKKWNNLKSYFTTENQKVYKAQKSGAGVEEVENIQSSWKFKSNLNFLSATTIPTPSVNNFNKRSLQVLYSEENNSSDVSQYFSESNTPTPFASQGTKSEFLRFEGRSSTPTPVSPDSFQDEMFLEEFLEPSLMPAENLTDPIQSPQTILSPPIPVAPIANNSLDSGHVKKKPRTVKITHNESLTTTLLEASKTLTEAITSKTNISSTDNSAFGACITTEINKLASDLQVTAKKQIFSIIMDLQAEQLRRK